jgi:hypothetical protein
MKVIEHLKSYCTFWKPSVARRITVYFLIFGMIIFVVTSILYTIGAKKQFLRSAGRVIRHQFSQLEKGQKIQQDFLPGSIPCLPNWEIAACFYPAGKVSGDFYDVFTFIDLAPRNDDVTMLAVQREYSSCRS